ncbi:competence protein ComEA [Ventosimonas gracilis]|uniref:Competence protein ComEA n=1 Tax=Ventosimonas gracilis TaxID=1680762 RepID=A0A139SJ29_9GAMM|nr:ComEA family DNA-binding protein [Ventosimonas gracilis]KXU34582.1 competence protein ComEA [Ventosimonas gracilis]
MKHYLLRLIFIVFTSLPLFVSAAGEVVSVDAQSTAVVTGEQTIDLNSADAQALQQALTGVGAVKAKAIVDYRQEHGPFVSVDELLEVKGIGAAILEKNRSKLRVN